MILIDSNAAENDIARDNIIVSMGDSYSSGEGIEPFYGSRSRMLNQKVKNRDWLAHRSEKAWSGMLSLPSIAGVMSDHPDKNWYFVAASGAETKNITTEEQNRKYFKKQEFFPLIGSDSLPLQDIIFDELKENGKKADYVTLTIGGNDVGFTELVRSAAKSSMFLGPAYLSDKINDAWRIFYQEEGVREKLADTYVDICDKAGEQATLLVVGYPQLINPKGWTLVFSENAAQQLNNAAHHFNKEIEQVVNECKSIIMKDENGNLREKTNNIYFVSVEDIFSGHGAYAKDSYINGIELVKSEDIDDEQWISSYSFHPNEKGAQAYADCVQAKIDWLEGRESRESENKYNNRVTLNVYDILGWYYNNYTIDIIGTYQTGLFGWKKEEYKVRLEGPPNKQQREIFFENNGTYTITITDNVDRTRKYSKTVEISDEYVPRNISYFTDFGVYCKETEKENVEQNIPSDAVEFNGHYYKVIQDDAITNWDAALQYCNAQNGYLATISSQEENDFLYSYIKQAGYESAYFGLSDAAYEGTWTWANGESVTYTNWHENEPNGESSNEDYALFYYKYSDGTWNDGDFGNRTVNGGTAFICEWGDYESAPADESVYAIYRDAAEKTTASGNWQEHLNMTASMNLASEGGKEKAKANVTMEANANVQDYDETNLSKMKISGDAYIQVGGQRSAWKMTYADGTAHYQYTEPNEYSTDLKIDPVYFEFSDMTSDMMQNAEISDGKIKFTVSGDQMTEVTQETVNMMGVDAIEYETGEIEIQINDETDTIDHINMTVHASMRYMGYNAEVDYLIKYHFVPGTIQNDEEKQKNSADLYKDIFQQYVSAVRYYDGCSDEELASRYPDVNAYLVNSNQKDGSQIWYAYYDIDGNGIEELFWGYETIHGIEWKMVDVFTYDLETNQVVNLGNNELISEYAGSFIYENGVICIFHGEQAGFYRMNSAGSQIELFNEYTRIGKYPDIYYFNDQERLNEEEMNELRKQQGNEISVDWIVFNPDEMDTDIRVENDVKYEYSTGEFLSEFSVTGNRAILSFWHNYGGSSSDEDFSFEWNVGKNEYEVQGQRSKEMFRLTFVENGNEMKITVTSIEGNTYSWTSGEKSNTWVDAVYTKK